MSESIRSAQLGDPELVERAQAGDRQALEQLLRRHHDRIAGLCRRLCGGGPDADDATQEALMGVVRGLARFDGRAAFATWAYRVATNACLDELRRRTRRPAPTAWVDRPRGDHADAVSAGVDVDRALAGLPLEFRTAVVLRDLCGLDYAEIASILGVPVGTVRSRIARGRAGVADAIGNPAPPDDRHTSQP